MAEKACLLVVKVQLYFIQMELVLRNAALSVKLHHNGLDRTTSSAGQVSLTIVILAMLVFAVFPTFSVTCIL